MAFLPQSSKSVSGTSVRAGTEPLTTLKADWNAGSSIADGHLQLRRLLVVADLEHHELVGVEGDGALRAREADADEVRARLLAGLEEFALGPVAHDLHAGLALDDHGGGQVPVAAGEVVVDIGAQLGHAVEGFLHLVAAERRRIEVDEGRLVEVGAERQHDRVEDGRVLPGLAAMGERR